MGFQSGSQIRPELGALDYSGYTRAAAINAQAMSNLGQKVGGAIEGYYKKKKEKDEYEMTYNALLPYVKENLGDNPDAENVAKLLAKDPELGGAAIQMGMQSREQNAQKNAFASAYTVTEEGNKLDPKVALDSYINQGGNDARGFSEVLKQFQEKEGVIVDPKTGVVTQDGSFKGITRVDGPEKETVPTSVITANARQADFEAGREAFRAGDKDTALSIARKLDVKGQFGGFATIEDLTEYYNSPVEPEVEEELEEKKDPLGLNK